MKKSRSRGYDSEEVSILPTEGLQPPRVGRFFCLMFSNEACILPFSCREDVGFVLSRIFCGGRRRACRFLNPFRVYFCSESSTYKEANHYGKQFRVLLPTRVIFGKGTEQRVGALVREYGGTRVLIVYGGKSAVRSGVLDRAENSLAEAGISSWTLGGVVPNPHLDKVYEGIRIGKENSIDFLLAVGGGSVIDTAKAIAYGLAEPEKDVWELYEHTRTARKCLPVASILTIAAAGSETSNSSVITRVDTHQKRAYNDDISRPKFALMDPELTKTLPDYQTESGCADIMMHTMERYFTNGGNMELTTRWPRAC